VVSEAEQVHIEEKELAAVLAAVGLYMASEEEAVVEAMLPRPVVPEPEYRPWSLGGRRAQMEQRFLMQMRAFR
jgi:hypothetical protein